MRRMLVRVLILGVALSVAGCDRIPTRISNLFTGTVPQERLPFPTRLRRDGRLDPGFTVFVRPRGATLDQIRESVRYPGTRYCLATFGTSEIDWRASGSPRNWVAVPARSGEVAFRGRCDFR